MYGLELTSIIEAQIQNLVCQAAEELATLELDPDKPMVFIQKQAALTGQIRILSYILDLSSMSRRAKIAQNDPSRS